MPASRQPGSDRGRAAIDWEHAFQYYASLPDPERSYQTVASHFQVSVRTVEKHGRQERWKSRLANVHAQAAEQADSRLAEQRAAKLAELELLIDATMTTYAHQLRSGSVRVNPADLQRLFKLREELWAQEAADHNSRRAAQTAEAANDLDPQERTLELIRALHEAGAFDRLHNLIAPTAGPPSEVSPGVDTERDAERAA